MLKAFGLWLVAFAGSALIIGGLIAIFQNTVVTTGVALAWGTLLFHNAIQPREGARCPSQS